jgi:hypothetical protein
MSSDYEYVLQNSEIRYQQILKISYNEDAGILGKGRKRS